MRLGSPFYYRGRHIGIDLPGARAVFTTRRGGYSAGPYESLNLGRTCGDRPPAVDRNRAALEAELGVRLSHIRQVHGGSVRRITSVVGESDRPVTADGQATALAGVAPTVLVADCLPIVVAGDRAVAMLHAGWRGLASGVVEEGVRAVRELGVGGALTAAIGPGAGPCCYEVGEEVHRAFPEAGGSFHQGRKLDLKAIARDQLVDAGVDVVHDVGLCTICSERELLFSHRRDGGVTGRQAGIAWLT